MVSRFVRGRRSPPGAGTKSGVRFLGSELAPPHTARLTFAATLALDSNSLPLGNVPPRGFFFRAWARGRQVVYLLSGVRWTRRRDGKIGVGIGLNETRS